MTATTLDTAHVVNGDWHAKAELMSGALDSGVFVLAYTHAPTKLVRLVLNGDDEPATLAVAMVDMIADILDHAGPDAADVAAQAAARILGDHLDAVADHLRGMAVTVVDGARR
ncbi:hypothetical protein [Yinghuangia sp. YIM S10712]|uniref:hypothetical protein n=1 Tax=Yinghuangia sp. YIM S10712 TaxID=3436930 RepID=UPI003F532367